MTSKSTKSFAKIPNIIFIGFTFGFLAWFLDAAVDTYLFHQGTFMNNIMAPGSEQIWIRSFIVFLMIVFSGIVQAIINKRKSIEAALLVSEERYRRLEAVSAEGILIHDGEKILDVNQILLDVSGYEREELVGQSPLEWLTPESREKAAANIRSGYDEPYELTAVKKDGSIIAIEINARSVEYDGQIVRVASLRLVQAKKKATEINEGASEKYRSLLYGGNDPLFVYGLSNEGGPDKFVEVNDMACIKFGYTRDEYEKLNILSMVVPEDRDNISAIFQTLIDFKHSVFETEILTKDDDRIPVEISSHLVEQSGTPIIISSMRETTERRKAEQALRANEKRYRILFSQAPVAYHILDKDGIIIDVNDKWVELLGHPADDAVGSWFGDYLERASLDRFNAAFADLKESGGDTEMELDLTRKDGSIVNINLTASTLRRAVSDAASTYCILRDISERRMNEDEKEKQDELVEFLIDRSDNLICTLALDGTVSDINPAFENIAGKAAIGRKFEALVHPDDATFAEQTISKCVQGEKIPPIEVRVQPASGDCIAVEFSFRTQYKNGKPAGITGTARDLTRRWQPTAEAEEAGGSEILTESLTDAACLIDNDFKIVNFNSDFEKLCTESGTSGDLIGRSITDTKPFNTEKLCHFIDSLIEQGAIGTLEEAVESNSGEVNIEITGIPIFRNEKTSKLLVVCRDKADLKLAEKGLTESGQINEKLRFLTSAVEQSSEGIALVDMNGNLQYINNAFANMHGYRPEELIGKPLSIFHTPEQMPAVNEANRQIKETGAFVGEIWHVHRNGTVFPTIMNNSLIRDENGKPIGLTGTTIDITEYKKTQEALRASEENFRLLISNIPDVLWTSDSDGKTTFISPNVKGIYGYSPEEIYENGEMLWFGRIHPEDIDRVKSEYGTFIKGEHQFDIEYRIRKKDGQWIWLHDRAIKSYNEAGEVRVDGVFSDITDRKNTEQAIKISEERYRNLIENATEGILVAQDGQVKFANPRVMQFSGFSKEDLMSRPFQDFIHPDDQEKVINYHKKRIRGEPVPESYDLRILTADGSTRWLEISGIAITWDGKPAALNFIYDVTDRRLAEINLRESEQKYSAIFNEARDGIVLIDAETGSIADCNPEFEKLTGRKREQLSKMKIWEIRPPEKVGKAREVFRQAIQEERCDSKELEFQKPDGEIVYIEFSCKKIEIGGKYYVQSIARDITERIKAEHELKKLSSRNKSILEAIPDIIMEVDKNKVYTWANRAGINFFGDDVIGKEASEYFDGKQETYEKVQSLFEGDENTTYVESWQRRHDGEKRILAWWCRVLKDADGNVTGALSTARDITEQRNAEEALRQSERKYSELVQESPDAIISLDMSGNFLSFNLMAEKITGFSSDVIIGKHFTEIGVLDAESLPMASDEFTRIINGEERPPFSLTVMDKDKNPVVMDVHARLIKSDIGNAYIQAVFHDITERKQFEEALKQSEEKFRNIVESSVDGIVLVNEECRIVEWNHGQELITGLCRDEILGYQIYDIQHQLAIEENRNDEMYKMLKSTMQEISKTGQSPFLNRFIETEIRRPDGARRIVDMLSFPIKSGDGYMVCIITRDVTDKKRAEKELAKAEKLESIGVLAGGIAHDFNNILTAILGNISLARMAAQPGSDLFLRLSEAEKASGRAQNLTRQLLTFSKGGTPIKKSMHIAWLINESCGFALHGSNVKAVCNMQDGLSPVFVDEGQLSQVMNNLIINANQAMPDGGTIEIEAENISLPQETHLPLKEGQYVKISIKDEGGGIPEQYLKRIFDPYFTTKQKGSGLGLATTYSIIKNHDGHVEVKSQLNKGTTFIIYLPVSQTPPEISYQEDDLSASGNGKILIMDDEEAIRRVTGLALSKMGYKTSFAADGNEGLEVFREAFEKNEPFDAVILDLTIPGGMGGKEMLDKLREIDPGIKAIVSSGYSNDPIMSDHAESGFDGVIEKPFKAGELGGIVNQVLSGKKVSV